MARQPDIQYVHAYTYGTAAKKLEIPLKPRVGLPTARPRKTRRKVIYVDPMSLCALAAAGLLLVTMAVGMIRLGITNTRTAKLEEKVTQLRAENAELWETYQDTYDPAAVEQQGLQMGLVPRDEAHHVHMELKLPQQEAEPGFWERFAGFWAELFA